MKIHDEVITQIGLHGRPMKYRLRIWRTLNLAFFIVLFTEVKDNPGVTVTNWSERLATDALRRFSYLTEENTIWVENYQRDMESIDPFKDDAWDRFNQVEYNYNPARREFSTPTWRRLDREKLHQLAGEEIDLIEKGA